MADQERSVRVGQRKHGVRSEHGGQALEIQGLQQQRQRKTAPFLPHGPAVVAKALSRLLAKVEGQVRFLEHVKQRLIVEVVHEAGKPRIGTFAFKRNHQRDEFCDVRRSVQTSLVKDVHGLVLFPFA